MTIIRNMLPIFTSQIVIDELHLFLRVFDVLLRNLIFATLTADSGIMRHNISYGQTKRYD